MDILHILNPLAHFSSEAYANFFKKLFETAFNGWLARFFGFTCLFFAYWFWVRREQMARGVAFFIFALIFGYGWILFRIMGVAK
ncbi:hypothetical protein [Thermodesulfovibrio yellowstonii]|uniref:hypothetical protein n=1 Tax=Thermodesulfovibrio yellowstonii TaxID=28262 RepID=UPI0003F888C8|nr:hypothetical protein [Thermodesulfovibrio islandicus]